MRIFACIVVGMICLMTAAAAMADPEVAEHGQAYKDCQLILDKTINEADSEAPLQEAMGRLLQERDMDQELGSFLVANPDAHDLIFRVLRKCDKATVLTDLERLGWIDDETKKLHERIFNLRKDLFQSTPKGDLLKLAESSERPRVWAMGIAGEFEASEPGRVEALYCRWAQVEIGPDGLRDPDERHEVNESGYEMDILLRLVKLDTEKTIHEVGAAMDRYGTQEYGSSFISRAILELENSRQKEAVEAIRRVARNKQFEAGSHYREDAITALTKRADEKEVDDLIALIRSMNSTENAESHRKLLRKLRHRKRALSEQAFVAAHPVATQSAATQISPAWQAGPVWSGQRVKDCDAILQSDLAWPEKSKQAGELLARILSGPDATGQLNDLLDDQGDDAQVYLLLMAQEPARVQSALTPIMANPETPEDVLLCSAKLLALLTDSCTSEDLLARLEQETQALPWSATVGRAYLASRPQRIEAITLRWIVAPPPKHHDAVADELVGLMIRMNTKPCAQALAQYLRSHKLTRHEAYSDTPPVYINIVGYLQWEPYDVGTDALWHAAEHEPSAYLRITSLKSLAHRVDPNELGKIQTMAQEILASQDYLPNQRDGEMDQLLRLIQERMPKPNAAGTRPSAAVER